MAVSKSLPPPSPPPPPPTTTTTITTTTSITTQKSSKWIGPLYEALVKEAQAMVQNVPGNNFRRRFAQSLMSGSATGIAERSSFSAVSSSSSSATFLQCVDHLTDSIRFLWLAVGCILLRSNTLCRWVFRVPMPKEEGVCRVPTAIVYCCCPLPLPMMIHQTHLTRQTHQTDQTMKPCSNQSC